MRHLIESFCLKDKKKRISCLIRTKFRFYRFACKRDRHSTTLLLENSRAHTTARAYPVYHPQVIEPYVKKIGVPTTQTAPQ